ncbi:MAG: PcfB family protein [Lachnospiraceae bacterium]|nr:PcfB family protein [Lachnospiraceae bacterium]
MQEELTSRTMTLIIETGKLTTSVLQKAIRESVGLVNSARHHTPKGKQSLSKLKSQGVSLSNVEITKDNIKSFDTVAKKYKIDYALMKQDGSDPPRYYVFFKGADAEVLDAAFKEYVKKEFHLEEKGSLKDVLDAVARERSMRVPEKAGTRVRTKKRAITKSEIKVPELKR